MKINLSIIIPVYNAKKTIQNAINSINKQKLKIKDLKVEIIIIIDDGKKYEDFIPKLKNWISIKIIKTNGIKTGPGNARNIGLKKANGKYIGFLDADDEWSESYITEMYKLANKYEVAFAPTKIYEKGKEIYTFIGKEEGYLKLIDIGSYISISGIVTFKNSLNLVNTVQNIPLENLLVETDSPYLSPVPFRGKPNEPSYIKYTIKKISEIKKINENVIMENTTRNFINLFNLDINEA